MKKKETYHLEVVQKSEGNLYANEGSFITLFEIILIIVFGHCLSSPTIILLLKVYSNWAEITPKDIVLYLLGFIFCIGLLGVCVNGIRELHSRMSRLFISEYEVRTYRWFAWYQTGCFRRLEIESAQLYIKKEKGKYKVQVLHEEEALVELEEERYVLQLGMSGGEQQQLDFETKHLDAILKVRALVLDKKALIHQGEQAINPLIHRPKVEEKDDYIEWTSSSEETKVDFWEHLLRYFVFLGIGYNLWGGVISNSILLIATIYFVYVFWEGWYPTTKVHRVRISPDMIEQRRLNIPFKTDYQIDKEDITLISIRLAENNQYTITIVSQSGNIHELPIAFESEVAAAEQVVKMKDMLGLD